MKRKSSKKIIKLRRVESVIRKNHDKNISLEDISKISGVSKNFIQRTYREMKGKGVIDSLHDLRITKFVSLYEKKISSEERTNLKNMAEKFGYQNYQTFYRKFVKRYGEAPYSYLKKLENGSIEKKLQD